MQRHDYNPFDKALAELAASDLARLRNIREGWHIEYKRDPIGPEKIAKVLASFANTYGGWVFIGVDEANDQCASDFCGVPSGEVAAVTQQLRQAAAQHIQPAPHFDTKVILGPSDEIGLPEGRDIVVVQVPRSMNTPHVHSSGRILRRVADGTEEAEKDRHAIDQLYNRSKPLEAWHKRFIKEDPKLSRQERSLPIVRLIAMPDPWFERDLTHKLTPNEFRELLNDKGPFGAQMPFQSISTSAVGYIARQTEFNDPSTLAITWRFSRELISEVIFPISTYRPESAHDLRVELEGYECADHFVNLIERSNFSQLQVADLSFAFLALSGATHALARLMAATNCDAPLRYKVRLLNAWRIMPFVDVPAVIGHFEQFGVPVCLDDLTTVPGGHRPDSYAELTPKLPLENNDSGLRGYWHALMVFLDVAEAFGICREPFLELDSGNLMQLVTAGMNATKAQRMRNTRHGIAGP